MRPTRLVQHVPLHMLVEHAPPPKRVPGAPKMAAPPAAPAASSCGGEGSLAPAELSWAPTTQCMATWISYQPLLFFPSRLRRAALSCEVRGWPGPRPVPPQLCGARCPFRECYVNAATVRSYSPFSRTRAFVLFAARGGRPFPPQLSGVRRRFRELCRRAVNP